MNEPSAFAESGFAGGSFACGLRMTGVYDPITPGQNTEKRGITRGNGKAPSSCDPAVERE